MCVGGKAVKQFKKSCSTCFGYFLVSLMDLSQFYHDNSCWVILQFTVERNGLDLYIKNRIN